MQIDVARLTVWMMNFLPYNSLLTKVIHRVANYMQDGPVRTRYGYWIDYNKTGRFSTALRKSVISGSYERPYFEMLKCLINPGDTVIDVGSHEGYVSLWISKICGGGAVYSQ